ncbi:MAG: rod shape-determining protein RodA [Flavobacteriales bacterium CG_4_8_14_3_um_filter_35_10]|nr:MAG: rod shape-determining protein RodA [Flavobacteriaceae bacterium CG1_02_35_72]PIX06114.1 MAG: rod shape-determining protein RodA [Flavobacteriales bacterium CG_4_8_14_3_um_filter_35_10]
MRQRNSNIFKGLDWPLVVFYFLLVSLGWFSIYSASMNETHFEILDFSVKYGTQLLWILMSLILIIFTLFIDAKFYERFASLIYAFSILSLLGLFVFGKTISGATSWYVFSGASLQPSEFAKVATALALAKLLSDKNYNLKLVKNQIKAFFIIILPALIIIPQPDPGSALVFFSLIFVLYHEGLPKFFIGLGISIITLFFLALLINKLLLVAILTILTLLFYFIYKSKKTSLSSFLILLIVAVSYVYTVDYVFNHVFEQRHRDRINIIIGKVTDFQGIGYNTHQSEIAIGSGRFLGKGYLQGTQTQGNFVPQQHTDYIFSIVGEEFGFVGSTLVVLFFMGFILRILYVANRQKIKFSRVYGYSIATLFLIHFTINIGMVLGMIPTIGIPLPFFSYGGSSLWGFTLMLFIFIRLDANKFYEW